MKKTVKKLRLSRETVQGLVADGSALRRAAAGVTNTPVCSRLNICTQSCQVPCP